jgi:hypothetical protein
VHWHSDEAGELLKKLDGFEVFVVSRMGLDAIRAIRSAAPGAVVISLERMPSHGRYLAHALREYKGTRHIPLVFVEGEPDKVERIRGLFPDAAFAHWRGIDRAIRLAIAHPPAAPVTPGTSFAYTSTPLVRKLGIRADTIVGLLNAPPDVAVTLGDLPEGARLVDFLEPGWTVLLWFVRTARALEDELEWVAGRREKLALWIFWPKRASGVASDLTPAVIRALANRHNLTDYKMCAFDKTWSGMVFARRRGK